MADSYSNWVMTAAFANNSQAALNAGNKIEWVSIKSSDDTHAFSDLSGFNDTTLSTASIKQTANISSVTITGNTVTITGLFNSNDNTADYYIRTLFLVAKYNGTEFLAGATIANTSGSAFRMPAASRTEITEFTARPQISVTNTSAISATVNPVASATNERVDGLEDNLQGQINAINTDKQNLWKKLSDYVTKGTAETISGVKTFTQTIVGSITGNAGTATKLQTPRKINGTAFDGTADINVNAANDTNLVHTAGDESMSGTKTFSGAIVANNPIKGVLDYPFPTDTDLNNLTKMGQYKIGANYPNTPTGMPVAAFIFVYNFDGNLIYQTIFARQITDVYQKLTIWTRIKISGAWGPWQSIAKDGDVLHLTGNETANGDKTFLSGSYGFRITSSGVQKTSDNGATWTTI